MSRIVSFFRTTALWILILPYAFTFVGAASNQLVLIANHDKFPVMANPLRVTSMGADPAQQMMDPIHCQMTHDTHLNALADIFDLQDAIYSIGDFFIGIGEWLSGFCFYVWLTVVVGKLTRQSCPSQM